MLGKKWGNREKFAKVNTGDKQGMVTDGAAFLHYSAHEEDHGRTTEKCILYYCIIYDWLWIWNLRFVIYWLSVTRCTPNSRQIWPVHTWLFGVSNFMIQFLLLLQWSSPLYYRSSLCVLQGEHGVKDKDDPRVINKSELAEVLKNCASK